jgi:hypothetical protein
MERDQFNLENWIPAGAVLQRNFLVLQGIHFRAITTRSLGLQNWIPARDLQRTGVDLQSIGLLWRLLQMLATGSPRVWVHSGLA